MKDLPCSMCYKTRCLNNYQCMLDIKPEEVISEISPILKLKKR